MKKLFSYSLLIILLTACAGSDTEREVNAPKVYQETNATKDRLSSLAVEQKQEPTKQDDLSATAALLEGIWLHEKDSLAHVTIKNLYWTFSYQGQEPTEEDKYKIALTDKLPNAAEPEEGVEYIILTNQTDTMYYALNGVTEEILSLMWLPAGKLHVYRRGK